VPSVVIVLFIEFSQVCHVLPVGETFILKPICVNAVNKRVCNFFTNEILMENNSISYNGSDVPKIGVCGYPVYPEVLESVWIVAGVGLRQPLRRFENDFADTVVHVHIRLANTTSSQWAVNASNFRMLLPCICWTTKKTTDAVSGWESRETDIVQT